MTLQEVRVEIDRVDAEIKKLFKERMMLADEIAKVKAETADDIFKPEREIQIIDKLTAGVDNSIVMEYTALIKRIMEISRKYQYGRTLQLRHCLNIPYGEEDLPVKKAGMLELELYLLNSMSKDLVTTAKNYDELKTLIEEGEVDAGIGVLEEIGIGVSDPLHKILSENELYINKCEIVNDRGVEKKLVTFTRNLVVKPEHNRLKIVFVCKNKSGSLASILSMISDYGVNLSEIHSRPNNMEEWNYEFMVEMTANFLKEDIKALVFQLMSETQYFKIMGSYEVAE